MRWIQIIWIAAALAACQQTPPKPASVQGIQAQREDLTPQFQRKDLLGVWEVVGYYINGLPRPETRLNVKYCFGEDEVYPGLPPDQVNDSAEGQSDWFITKNLLIFEGSMGVSPRVLEIEKLENDRLVLRVDARETMTLRRIQKTWHGKSPVLKPKQIPVNGMYPSPPSR